MTNTRITDPEIFERRYPVLLREFSIREGSGGDGLYRGGDGVVRDIELLEPIQCSILSEVSVFNLALLDCADLRARTASSERAIRDGGRRLSSTWSQHLDQEDQERGWSVNAEELERAIAYSTSTQATGGARMIRLG